MIYLKQALIQIRTDWKNALLLGCVATLLIMMVRFIPFGSAFLISLGLLFLQQATEFYLKNKVWPRRLEFMKGHWPALVACALILIPTSALLGAATGLLQSTQQLTTTLPLSLGMYWIAVYFYLIIAHSLRFRSRSGTLPKAIDQVAMSSLRRFRSYFSVSFNLTVAIMISSFVSGAGYILTLPLLFFATAYSYQDPLQK